MTTSIIPACLLPALLLALIYLVVFPNDFKLQSAFAPCSVTPASSTTSASARLAAGYTADLPVDVRLFLGVLTRAELYERRAHLRLAYQLQPQPSRAVIDVRFVLCGLDKEEDAVLVSLEIITYGDIVVLNCTENMNDGKTYDYFAAIPRLFADAPYDYVGKTDDDTYYRLAALADSLRDKPRRDMYHGYLTPCHFHWQFMAGMGYIVSWDLAQWISATAALRDDREAPEDMSFADWLRKAGKGKNVFGEEPRMYDYLDREMWEGALCSRHELIADTVAVHKLKERIKWARTLKFFNATQGLKPSKMYNVDLLR